MAGLNNHAIMGHAYRTSAKGLSRAEAALDHYYRVSPFRSLVFYEIQASKLTSEVKGRDKIVAEIQDDSAMFNIFVGTPETGVAIFRIFHNGRWFAQLCLSAGLTCSPFDCFRGQLQGSAPSQERVV